jgi:excinuclease ABC subunit C
VDSLFPCPALVDFGPNGLDPAPEPAAVYQVHGSPAALLRERVRAECPRRPGVYGMVDGHGELIYIGKAKCLRTRLLSYFRPRSRDPKAGRILQRAGTIAWECSPSEFAALHRELELIRRWRPRFNVQGQPHGRRLAFVCLGRRPAPYVFLAPRPSARYTACFGPVRAGRHAREAVRRLNDWFALRDCTQAQEMYFADQRELFPVLRSAGCLRYEIGTCLGPCAGACSRAAYAERVRAARAFLAGTDTSSLQTLERDMAAASEALAFERAAVLRDKLTALRWLHDQLDLLRRARERQSFVYPVPAEEGERWYLIHGGRTVAALLRPQDDASREAAAAILEAAFHGPSARAGTADADAIDGVLLVNDWFRRHPDELARTLPPADALALLRGATPPA